MEIVLELQDLHPNQRRVRNEASRFNVVCCGRRWGKTTLAIDLMGETALEGYPVAYFAPTYKMLSEVWREASSLFRPVATRVSAQEHRIDLVTGGTIDMWSLDVPDAARGRKYKRAIPDEAAMVRGLEDAWQAVIRPTLADLQGDAWFLSTPKGFNFFRTMYEWGKKDGRAGWKSWRFPTQTNPYILLAEVEAMQAEMPQRVYEQEVQAEFIEDGTYFRNVNQCAVIDAPDSPDKHQGHTIVFGVDWGKHEDFTVNTVFCRDCARVVDWDRTNQIGYAVQRERIVSFYERWYPMGILPERNSIGEPNIEMLRAEDLPILLGPDGAYGFNTMPTTKPKLIESLALAIERHEIEIPREYAGELLAYEIEVTDSGKSKWSAPSGQHDDRVISLALAYWAASHSKAQVWI